jgi:hypothetical protein
MLIPNLHKALLVMRNFSFAGLLCVLGEFFMQEFFPKRFFAGEKAKEKLTAHNKGFCASGRTNVWPVGSTLLSIGSGAVGSKVTAPAERMEC